MKYSAVSLKNNDTRDSNSALHNARQCSKLSLRLDNTVSSVLTCKINFHNLQKLEINGSYQIGSYFKNINCPKLKELFLRDFDSFMWIKALEQKLSSFTKL